MTELDSAPQARCALHTEAAALMLCPRCGDGACAQCWSIEHGLCLTCAKRDPLHAVVPLPWEDLTLSRRARVFRTWLSLLRPGSHSKAFARGGAWPAVTFWLWVTLPLACLSGVIPLTRTLLFMPTLAIQLIGAPSGIDIVWDVVRAAFIGAVTNVVLLVVVWLSLLIGSLFGAARIWVRSVLYWSWLPPVILLSLYIPTWLTLSFGWMTLTTWPLVLLWWVAQGYVARRAAGFGWLRTILTVCCVSMGAFVGLAVYLGLFAAFGPDPAP